MPKYKYKAVSEDGTILSGELFANSHQAVKDELAGCGIFATKVVESRLSGFSHRPKREDLLFFIKEFIILLRTGSPVPDALNSIASDRNDRMASHITQVRLDILRGSSLSQAFSKVSGVFDPLLISMLATGEQTGELIKSLKYYEGLLRQKIALTRKLRQALFYPAFVMLIVAAIMIIIFEFSLPRFIDIYADLDTDLPAATQLLLDFGGNFRYILILMMGVFFLLYSSIHYARKRPVWAVAFDHYMLRLPIVGKIQRAYLISLLGRTLSSLLSSGTPLVEALYKSAETLKNQHFSSGLKNIAHDVARGASLAKAMTGKALLPAIAEKIIVAGEQSGSLPEQLDEMAQFYEEEIEHRLAVAISLVEPLLILVTGILVGAIVIVMYLPIFSLAGAIS